jgi:Zn-dependent M28 family amino/carboxypeptidase
MADVRALCSPELAGRGSYQPGARLAGDYLAAELAAAGLEIERQPIPGGAENVIGIKRGGPRALIVSAHHDHLGARGDEVFWGADDNASGVAVILGIARSLRGVDLDHTVLFIGFGAEERGLIGSGAYVKQPLFPLEQTVAVINFDMVGRDFFDAGASTPRTAAVVGTEGSDRARDLVRAGAAAAGLRIVETPARLLQLFRIENRTDDWWFRRHEVLSIHFSTGLHDDYHRVTDTVDKLVPGQLERIARTAAHLVRGLASSPSTFAAARE